MQDLHPKSGFQNLTQTLSLLGLLSVTTITTITTIAAPVLADQVNPASQADRMEVQEKTFWTPIARLNLDKPQRITINNKTGISLEYLVTTHTDFRVMNPGQSVTLSNIATPFFLNINAQDSNSRVKYEVSVDKARNLLTVNVMLTNGEDNRTLNVNETGGVYLY